MKNRLIMVMCAATVLVTGTVTETPTLAAGPQQQTTPAVHRFKIGKLNGKWKVFDEKNSNNRMIIASRGDKVIWSAVGSDAFIQFPDAAIFGLTETSVASGKAITLTVSPNAKPGRYPYSIFCLKDKQYATGDSVADIP